VPVRDMVWLKLGVPLVVAEEEHDSDTENEPVLLCVVDVVLLSVREKLVEPVPVKEEVREVVREEVLDKLPVSVCEDDALSLQLLVPDLLSEMVRERDGEKVEVLVRLTERLDDTVVLPLVVSLRLKEPLLENVLLNERELLREAEVVWLTVDEKEDVGDSVAEAVVDREAV